MDKKNFFPKLYPLSRDISKTWFVQYQDKAGRPQKVYGKLNKLSTVAERMREARKLIKKLTDPQRVEIRQRTDLIGNLDAALEYKRPSLAKKSYQCYFSHLKKFSEWYRPAKAKKPDISPAEYIRFMYEQDYHNNYILKAKIFLGCLFKDLVKQLRYPHNPFEGIKVKKLKSQSLLPFHPNQVATIKEKVIEQDPQLWDAILFQYYLFFRPAEIRQLRIENILFDEMRVEAGVRITKDDDVLRKAIPVPMQDIINKFRGYPSEWFIFSKHGQPGSQMLSMNNLTKRHRKILDQLNISNRYGFYSWVHTGIRESAMSGIPHKQLQLQKGHSDLKVFDEYLKSLGVEDCVQLINNFPVI
ncbi:MAG: site-specific integrase [Flavobacteriales bacterium]|nr:site-specific integrase [Flavobacteriales bacterium]